MQVPLTDPDTLFEDLWQEVPAAGCLRARECKALVGAKKVKTPEHRLRVGLLEGGWDTSWRTVAGPFSVQYEPLTDQAGGERWRAWGPWGKALLRPRVPLSPVAALPEGKRCRVSAGSTVQAPGAPGTEQRLPLWMDLVSWEGVEVLVSAVQRGETFKHWALGPGVGVGANRGEAQPQGRRAVGQHGAELSVRLNPFRVGLRTPRGQPWALGAGLQRPQAQTMRTLPVVIRAAGGHHEGRGWGQA